MTIDQAARILAHLDRSTADRLLAHLETCESGLGDRIRDEMFLFEDLEKLNDRGLQLLLRETPADELATALRGAAEPLIRRFAANLSQRAAEALHEALTLSTPMSRRQVEAARKAILATARTLETRGRLILPSRAIPVIY